MVLFAGVAEVARVSNFVSFEPDQIEVFLDDTRLALEPGQAVSKSTASTEASIPTRS